MLSPITCCASIYSINLISKCFKAVCHDMPHWSLSRRSAEGRLTANHTIRCNQLEIKSKKWFCGPTLFHLFKRKISPWFGADHLWSIWSKSILWETWCYDSTSHFILVESALVEYFLSYVRIKYILVTDMFKVPNDEHSICWKVFKTSICAYCVQKCVQFWRFWILKVPKHFQLTCQNNFLAPLLF